jgi:hypothetical protein
LAVVRVIQTWSSVVETNCVCRTSTWTGGVPVRVSVTRGSSIPPSPAMTLTGSGENVPASVAERSTTRVVTLAFSVSLALQATPGGAPGARDASGPRISSAQPASSIAASKKG